MVLIRKSDIHGRGVFADKRYGKGQTIEECEVLLVPSDQLALIDRTVLFDYYYSWLDKGAAVALGAGSLYNHSYSPNAIYKKDYKKGLVEFKALRDIAKGEEICINYNGDPVCQYRVWFDHD